MDTNCRFTLSVGLFAICVVSAAPATCLGMGHVVSANGPTAELPYHPHFADGIHNIWGAKFVGLSVFNRGHDEQYYGPGIFLERVLIPHLLETEVTTAAAMNSHGVLVPVDILLKKPFNLHPRVEPFIGAGLALAIHVADGHALMYPGAIFSGGTSIWLSRHVGLTLEVDYSMMSHEGLTTELELAAGAAWRFE